MASQAEWDLLWLRHCRMEVTGSTNAIRHRDPFALGLDWEHLMFAFNDYNLLQRGVILRSVALLSKHARATTRQALKPRQTLLALPMSFDPETHNVCERGQGQCAAPMPELFQRHQVIESIASQPKGTA